MSVLYDAFRASMKGSAWKTEVQRFEINFLSELTALQKELLNHEYRTSEGSEFTLKERGHIRHIHGSRIRDRVVRHALCDNILEQAIEPYLYYNNGASRKGKGVGFTRKNFEKDLHNYCLEHGTNDGYVGFLDLSKFYDNIRHDRVKELLYPLLDEFSRGVLDEILRSFEVDVSYMTDEEYTACMDACFNSICYYENVEKSERTGKRYMKKSLNIGDQTSQNIGTFFPTRIDNYVSTVRGCRRYGRYMDDMYIICSTREELQSIIDGVKDIAHDLGLFINDDKTRIYRLSEMFIFLQTKYYVTDTGKVVKRINPKAITRERRRLKAYKRLMEKGLMTYPMIEQAYKSWMGDFTRIMSKKQIKNMKALYKELYGKEPRWKK